MTYNIFNETLNSCENIEANLNFNLLSMQYQNYCGFPRFDGDIDNGYNSGDWIGYIIDKELLYAELAKRPHRVRKRDKRKPKVLKRK